MKPLTIALYARVSGEEQSVASQVAALRQLIAAEDCVLLPEHEFLDEGYTGSTLLRPALERLRDVIAGVPSGKWRAFVEAGV